MGFYRFRILCESKSYRHAAGQLRAIRLVATNAGFGLLCFCVLVVAQVFKDWCISLLPTSPMIPYSNAGLAELKSCIETMASQVGALSKLGDSARKSKVHFGDRTMWQKVGNVQFGIMVYVYASTNSVATCVEFLSHALRQKPGYVEPGDGYDAAEIQAWLDSAYTPEILADIKTHLDRDGHFAACRFLAERELFLWLCCMNVKGVSPPTAIMLEKFQSSWPLECRGAKMQAYFLGLATKASRRFTWIDQFRKTWMCKFRVMPARPPISDTDIKRKAICFIKIGFNSGSVLVEFLWPESGPKKQAHLIQNLLVV